MVLVEFVVPDSDEDDTGVAKDVTTVLFGEMIRSFLLLVAVAVCILNLLILVPFRFVCTGQRGYCTCSAQY